MQLNDLGEGSKALIASFEAAKPCVLSQYIISYIHPLKSQQCLQDIDPAMFDYTQSNMGPGTAKPPQHPDSQWTDEQSHLV